MRRSSSCAWLSTRPPREGTCGFRSLRILRYRSVATQADSYRSRSVGEGRTRAQVVAGAGRLAAGAALLGPAGLLEHAGDALAAGDRDVQRFVTRPDLTPPTLTVLRRGETAAGDLFLAPSSGPGQRGVMIADSRGELVWFHPTTPQTAMNFRAARYRGKPVLTWWEGKATSGLGTGTHV